MLWMHGGKQVNISAVYTYNSTSMFTHCHAFDFYSGAAIVIGVGLVGRKVQLARALAVE